MKKFCAFGIAVTLASLIGRSAGAQQATVISGTVTSDANAPIQGASVAISGMGLGAVTNEAGQYTFVVPAERATGQSVTLVVRRIGFRQTTAAVTLSGGTISRDFSLTAAPTQLEEVVTTALGIGKSRREITNAQQQVSAEQLSRAPATNIVSALAGKIAGVQMQQATTQGGSARMVIRGANSINGNNEPLWVIDGIPVDNSNYAAGSQQAGNGGYDYGNTAQDLNPEDIESINVLKGPVAAALYGSRAANGAVIVTTKNGRGASAGRGFNWTANSNTTFETPLRLPEYQNTWGQGSGGVACDALKGTPDYATCGFSFVDGNYGGVNDGVDESWGPRLDGTPRMQFSLTTPGVGELRPWVAHPNNVRDFFETGKTQITNVAAFGANDRANYRLSFTNQDQQGIVPNNSLKRVTAALNAGAKVTDKLETNASIQYITNSGLNRPGTGYDEANPMMGFVWFGRQVDVSALKTHYVTPDGQQISWNYSYHNNPYWNQYMNTNHDDRDRVIGVASANYKFTSWLSGKVQTGTDFYRDFRNFNIAVGWIGGLFDGGSYANGGFQENTRYNRETNSEFLLSAIRSFGGLGLNANFGGNVRQAMYRSNGFGTDELTIPGTYNIGNSAKAVVPVELLNRKQVNSIYGQTELSWRDYAFLNVTARNDVSSTLPKKNNSYFYPSVSGSFVFTDALPMTQFAGLTTGKLRGGWSRVGNDSEQPYVLAYAHIPNVPFGGVPRTPFANAIPNADLKPEQTDAWEVGLDLQWFENRLGLEATYYDKLSSNQILNADVSRASGFITKLVNAGKISNKGIELQGTATPVMLGNGFQWDVVANYGQNRSRVEELYGDLSTVLLGPSHWGVTVEARKGEPYGAIYGTAFRRDANGNLVLSSSRGRPLATADKRVLGHYPPDWTGSLTNTLRYKSFDASAQLDTRQGGQLYSTGNMWGAYAGVLKETENRPANGILINGVHTDGSPNTTRTSVEGYYHSLWPIAERWVYDASFVKLRELRVGYTAPTSIANRVRLSNLRAAVVGRNLALWAKVPNIDPETALSSTNLQGIEMGQLPSTRSIGFQITVTP